MSNGDQPILTSVSASLLEPEGRYRRYIIFTVAAGLCAAIAWSYFTNVIEVSAGTGQVIPERRLQVVQNMEGGVVQSILAKRGDFVKQGQTIVRLDPTAARSQFEEAKQQLAGLEAASLRLKAMIEAVALEGDQSTQLLRRLDDPDLPDLAREPPAFPLDIRRDHPDLVQQNIDQFRAGLEELARSLSAFDQQMSQRRLEKAETTSRLASATSSLRYAGEELASLEKLLLAGAAGLSEVRNAKTKVNELKGLEEQLKLTLPRLDAAVAEIADQRAERLNNFRSRLGEMLTDTGIKRASLRAALKPIEQRAFQTEVRAPASGVVKTLAVSTAGQVVKPGESIAEIVPADGTLLIQVRIRPEDIAFIEPGMPALIKLSAFDFSIFGALPGKVDQIAGDSTVDETGATYYLVDVRAAAGHIERRGEKWPIKAGMVANVDIITGKRTIFQYLTKPIHRMAAMALRER